MKPLAKFIVFIIGVTVIAFNVLLYIFCEKQRSATDTIRNQQQVETKVNNNKFKYQQEQIERLSKDLEGAQQQIKDQKDAFAAQNDALLQEAEKREQIENGNKTIETSLVDIKAEADAIKQNMKSWQKDYVSVLAELDKKVDDSQGQIKSVEDNLVALNIPELKESIKSLKADIEKITQPPDNNLNNTLPVPDKKLESAQPQPKTINTRLKNEDQY